VSTNCLVRLQTFDRGVTATQDRAGSPSSPSLRLVAQAELNRVRPPSSQATAFAMRSGRLLLGANWDSSVKVVKCTLSKTRGSGLGSLKCELVDLKSHHLASVSHLALGKDNQTLVTSSADSTVVVWKLEGDRVSFMHIVRGMFVSPVCIAIETRVDVGIVVGSDGYCLAFSPETGRVYQRFRVPLRGQVARCAVSAQGDMIFVACAEGQSLSGQNNDEYKICKCNINAQEWTHADLASSVSELVLTNDGAVLITLGGLPGDAVAVWDARNLQLIAQLGSHRTNDLATSACYFGGDTGERWIALGTKTGCLEIFEPVGI